MSKTKVALVGLEWDLVDLIESLHYMDFIGVIDRPQNYQDQPIPYLGSDEEWEQISAQHKDLKVILTVDRFADRVRLSKHYKIAAQTTFVSPYSYISGRAEIGIGTIIQRNVTIMPQAKIGHYCKINVGATIHHESRVGDFCTLAPGSQVLGRVSLAEGVYVGAGAVIRQNCKVGAGAIIGAGAVVVKDVPPYQTVIGVPARELKKVMASV